MVTLQSPYIPLARKYRPSNFNQLLGQEVLVKTLSYCISNECLSPSYLLTGIQGVGKTSSARIIAKTVNCTGRVVQGSYIVPCNQCKNCTCFNSYNHPDIIEVDAASKTSVDDIRTIIEGSQYRPLLGVSKVFIIDEVHMLSKNAFNALLKVLEEPPKHVIFIFATTEVNKIPLTIISRCQRYDLRRLHLSELIELAIKITSQENLKFDAEALRIIAMKSKGSARDFISIIDQAAHYSHHSFTEENNRDNNKKRTVTAKIVSCMLGILDIDTMIRFIQLVIANDPKSAIHIINEIYVNGYSLEEFIQGVSDLLAELTKFKIIPNYHNVIYSNYLQEIDNILIGTSLSRLSILWQIFMNGISEINKSYNRLSCTEMLIIKAIYSCNLPTAEDIMDFDTTSEYSASTAYPSATLDLKKSSVTSPISIKSTLTDTANDTHSMQHNNAISNKTQIFDFLKFCYKNKEMDVYYLLLNDVEIEYFIQGEVKIAGKVENSMQAKIIRLLTDWSSINWSIKIINKETLDSLKNQMIKKIKVTRDYQSIKKYFPDANISDIVLNK